MVLVTGASAGIGADLTERLVKHGMKVVGCARRVELIQVYFVLYLKANAGVYACLFIIAMINAHFWV